MLLLGVALAQAAPPEEPKALLERCLAQLRSAAAIAGGRIERFEPQVSREPPTARPFFVQRGNGWSSGDDQDELRSDGRVIWTIQRGRKRYIRQDDFWGHDFGRHLLAGFEAALAADSRLPDDLRLERAEFDGRACLAASFRVPAGFDRVLYFDAKTAWPAGYEQKQKDGLHVTVVYRDVHGSEPRPPAAFTWKPEPGFVEIDLAHPQEPMAVGSVVPDVTLATPDGKPVRLGELLAGQKALLLDFWFVDCAPCRRALPVVVELAARLQPQRLALIGVDFGDTGDKIDGFLKDEKLALRAVRNGTGPDDLVQVLGVPSFPSLFLIGPDRKVLWREVGFDRGKLEAALRAAGFELPERRR